MVRRILRILPLGLGAAAMTAGALLLMLNLAAAALHLTGPEGMKLAPGLAGMTVADDMPASIPALLHGRFQAALARAIGMRLPLYSWAVRLRNQLDYSLLAQAAAPDLMVGSGRILLEARYAEEYCSRDLASWQPDGLRWAASVREMQDDVERQGKTFLYVVTPSKVAQYPQILPAGWACPARAADRAGLVPAWMGMLRDQGVHAVDTTAVVAAAHAGYPFALYPPGGTHWNAVGAALGMQAVMAGLDRLLPGRGLTPFRFTWRMAPHPDPEGTDMDLAGLLNLFSPPDDVPVPAVTVQPAPPPAQCSPPRVVVVGGSFMNTLGAFLGGLPCPVPVTLYQYWQTLWLDYPHGVQRVHRPVIAAARDAAVLSADVLIYEENEQVLRDPRHGRALLAFLRAHAAR